MLPSFKFFFTAWGRFLLLLALVGSTVSTTVARPKPVPHHGRIYIPKMLPTIIPDARAGYQTVLRGHASWYGKFFQGMETASGELYDRFEYTCAHKKLPFNTRLRVTNLKNGLTVVVRVTDRGPYRRERIIDLSEKAASKLDILDNGQTSVIAVVVPETTPLGPANTPANLDALLAGDPQPKAPFTAYLLPLPSQEPAAAAATALLKEPAGPLAGLAAAINSPLPGAAYAAELGRLAGAAQSQAVENQANGQPSGVAALSLHGNSANRTATNQLDNWLAAETVRRNLQGWAVASQMKLLEPSPESEPDASSDTVLATVD